MIDALAGVERKMLTDGNRGCMCGGGSNISGGWQSGSLAGGVLQHEPMVRWKSR